MPPEPAEAQEQPPPTEVEPVAVEEAGEVDVAEVVDGVGVVRARNRWVTASGDLVCRETRTLRFFDEPDAVVFDFDVTLHAPATGSETECSKT